MLLFFSRHSFPASSEDRTMLGKNLIPQLDFRRMIWNPSELACKHFRIHVVRQANRLAILNVEFVGLERMADKNIDLYQETHCFWGRLELLCDSYLVRLTTVNLSG